MTRAQPSEANPLAGVARAQRVGTVLIPQPEQQLTAVAKPLPRNTPRRRMAGLLDRTVSALRAMSRTKARTRSKREYHPPRRESFMEEATMRREMFRL